MSAVAEPKADFKKKPTKWQWRLAAGRFAKAVATDINGQILSAMSNKAWMTCRDISNRLGLTPQQVQWRLEQLRAKDAVERRIIPGSIYDESSTEPAPAAEKPAPVEEPFPAFDSRIVPGSIVSNFGSGRYLVLKKRKDEHFGWGFSVLDPSGRETFAYNPAAWPFVEQTPNPIAFNQGRYDECFEAPPIEDKPAFPFEVHDKVFGKVTHKPYTVGAIGVDGTMRLVDADGNNHHFCDPDNYEKAAPVKDVVGAALPVVEEKVEAKVEERALTIADFGIGDKVYPLEGNVSNVEEWGAGEVVAILGERYIACRHQACVDSSGVETTFWPAGWLKITEKAKNTIADFSVGDKVRINKPQWKEYHGATGVVIEVRRHTLWIKRDDNGHCICIYRMPSSLEILEKAPPVEATKPEDYFKPVVVEVIDEPAPKVDEGRKDDAGKPALQDLFKYFDARALGAVAEVMAYGAGEYGERNWEKPQLSKERLVGASARHLASNCRGVILDDKSKLRHLAHAAASALMALSKELGVCDGN